MRKFKVISVLAAAAVLAGCANVNTVGRTTSLGSEPTDRGVAIHLDAQQRVVLFSGLKYCAEPSPDALSSYAASLGLGGSAPTQGAASVASALQSNSGSIGLRTQSITLMRDALFRMCEAANNEHMNQVEVAAFLRRSQDLTAAVLAIEQLTGAVAATPIILTGTASSSATANVTANQQLLDQAEERLQEKETALDESEAKRDAAETELATAETDLTTKEAAYKAATAAGSSSSEEEKAAAKKARDEAQETRDAKKETFDESEADVELKTTQRDDAKEVRDSVRDSRNAALTNAAASTSGAGQFGVIQPARPMTDATSAAIATAVTTIVDTVLGKSYTSDVCLSFLTYREITKQKVAELKAEQAAVLRTLAGNDDFVSLQNNMRDEFKKEADAIQAQNEEETMILAACAQAFAAANQRAANQNPPAITMNPIAPPKS